MMRRLPSASELAVLLAAVGVASVGHYLVMQGLARLGVAAPTRPALSASLGGLAAFFGVGVVLVVLFAPRLPGTHGGRR